SVSLFREFIGENCEFKGFSSEELNKYIRAFFASIRKTDGSELKKSSLTSIKVKGSIEHKEEISFEDLQKLFSSENIAFDIDTPCELQKKVWFEILYFLCRRGQENLKGMKKDTFAVAVNAAGRRYVYQMQINCIFSNEPIGKGKMYELPGDVKCPVASFEKYLSKQHPQIDWLLQRPLDSFVFDGPIWYCMASLGKGKLA
ncbi:hypothetical protein MAR_016806, partial [Mya arenaria]